MACRHGFTLIELLVVIAIIAVLATMTLGGVSGIRRLLDDNQTTNRIEAVITRFSEVGQGEGSAALAFQRDAGFDGVLGWRQSESQAEMLRRKTPQGDYEYVPQALPDMQYFTKLQRVDPFASTRKGMDWKNIAYADKDKGGENEGTKPYLRFPWGEMVPQELLLTNAPITPVPDTFYLRHCSPHKTRELLTLAGVVPRTKNATAKKYLEYMTDRSPKRDWNDAWGRPLAVAFAMYQPPPNNRNDNLNVGTNDPTEHGLGVIRDACLARYGKDRSRIVYLSVAAIGPTLPATIADTALTSDNDSKWSGSSGIPALIWKRVVGDGTALDPNGLPTGKPDGVGVCQQGQAAKIKARPNGRGSPPQYTTGEWTERSWSDPPWQGVKKGIFTDPTDKLVYRCFLSSPKIFN